MSDADDGNGGPGAALLALLGSAFDAHPNATELRAWAHDLARERPHDTGILVSVYSLDADRLRLARERILLDARARTTLQLAHLEAEAERLAELLAAAGVDDPAGELRHIMAATAQVII